MGKGGGGSVFYHTRPTKKTPIKSADHMRAAMRYVTDARLRKVDRQIRALELSASEPMLTRDWIAHDYARLTDAVEQLGLAIDEEVI